MEKEMVLKGDDGRAERARIAGATAQERRAKVVEQVGRSCAAHGVIVVWEAWLKFRSDERNLHALPAVGIDNPYIADHEPFQKLHDKLPQEYLSRERIVFYLNEDTLETRHAFMPTSQDAFAFHPGFTPEDQQRGWKPQMAANAFYYPPTLLQAEHEKNVAEAKRFWLDLLQNREEVRVVAEGIHYVAYPGETGTGFYGQKFLINWLNADLAPTVCNLSEQGRVPAWIRGEIPDNATISDIAN